MSGRVLPFAPRSHEEALRLLPWLVNGSLQPEERGWLDEHVAGCPRCRSERALLEELHAACVQDQEDDAGLEAGWWRVRACVQPHAPAPSRWQAWRRRWARTPRWIGWTLAAQALIVFAAGTLLLLAPRLPTASADYRTLGAAPARGNLVVMVDPQMQEARWRGLLQASGARIVDGPNPTGAYVLAVAPARVAQACDALRAAPGVLLVERLDGAGGCAP
ncbi:MAG: zf-HC2 domain-containing protein [Lysobacteraceae bacterium]